jgi:hypothetical protein
MLYIERLQAVGCACAGVLVALFAIHVHVCLVPLVFLFWWIPFWQQNLRPNAIIPAYKLTASCLWYVAIPCFKTTSISVNSLLLQVYAGSLVKLLCFPKTIL